MEYNFLQNFTSLLEVFTAIYVSMFLDDILKNIWTPDYKKKINQLIEEMKISPVSFFVTKINKNIDDNAKNINLSMKRKATFLFVFCVSLLLLAGLDPKSITSPQSEYMIIVILCVITFIVVVLGKWFFKKLAMEVCCILFYCVIFVLLIYTDLVTCLANVAWLKIDNYPLALFSMLTVLSWPILYQLFLIWVSSSLYKGYLKEKISKEAYIYGKAYLAYKLKDMAALPIEYEMVAKDFLKLQPNDGEDTSMESLNSIFVRRLEIICESSNVIGIFFSWIKYNLRGRHNHEAEYIETNGLDYENVLIVEDNSENPIPRDAVKLESETEDVQNNENSDGILKIKEDETDI